MAEYSFGDVIVLPFSYTDLQSSKRRPALVLLDTDDGDVLVARITSKEYDSPYDILIDGWNELGLLIPSYIRLHKLIAVEKSLIIKRLSTLGSKDKESVKKTFQTLV
jgi:mRNA interferase MazF